MFGASSGYKCLFRWRSVDGPEILLLGADGGDEETRFLGVYNGLDLLLDLNQMQLFFKNTCFFNFNLLI